MLKNIMKLIYAHKPIENKELFYEIYKYESALKIILDNRIIIYLVCCALIIMMASFSENFIFHIVATIVSMLTLVYTIYLIFEKKKFGNSYQIRTMKLQEKIIKNFVTLKSNVIGKSGWKKIKRENKKLYKNLLSDKYVHLCYVYARKIALILTDVKLMYVSVCDHANDNVTCAHVIIKKNDKIYCTHFRRDFKLEEYTRFFDMKVYKEFDYEEYSNPDFCKLVKRDFVKWCNENNVSRYEYF